MNNNSLQDSQEAILQHSDTNPAQATEPTQANNSKSHDSSLGAGRAEAIATIDSVVDGSLLNKLAALRPEDTSRYKDTEQGWGYLLADVLKDEARYCPERKSWYVNNGTRWEHDPKSLKVGERVKQLADALHFYYLQLPENMRGQLSSSWSKWQKRSTRKNILADAESVYPISFADFDTDPYLYNVINGTLNLKTGKLQSHCADDLITMLAPVVYNPQATLPRWIEFVDEVTGGDKQKAKVLQQALGYTLSGSNYLEKLFMLHGATSRNGKTTTVETILGVHGDYGATADPEMLSTNRNTGGGLKATPDLARLVRARFVSLSELPKTMRLNNAQVKQLTGSDSVIARFLNENPFEFVPQFKLFFNTNDLPTASDMTLFKSGRVVVIPFDRHFTEAEQDNTLKQQFSTSKAKSAVLNWLLEGWQSLQSEGLILPDSVVSAIDDYRVENDAIKRFVDECLVPDANGRIKTATLLTYYQKWARDNGFDELGKNTFKGELERSGLTVKRCSPIAGGNPTSHLVGYRLAEHASNPLALL